MDQGPSTRSLTIVILLENCFNEKIVLMSNLREISAFKFIIKHL